MEPASPALAGGVLYTWGAHRDPQACCCGSAVGFAPSIGEAWHFTAGKGEVSRDQLYYHEKGQEIDDYHRLPSIFDMS